MAINFGILVPLLEQMMDFGKTQKSFGKGMVKPNPKPQKPNPILGERSLQGVAKKAGSLIDKYAPRLGQMGQPSALDTARQSLQQGQAMSPTQPRSGIQLQDRQSLVDTPQQPQQAPGIGLRSGRQALGPSQGPGGGGYQFGRGALDQSQGSPEQAQSPTQPQPGDTQSTFLEGNEGSTGQQPTSGGGGSTIRREGGGGDDGGDLLSNIGKALGAVGGAVEGVDSGGFDNADSADFQDAGREAVDPSFQDPGVDNDLQDAPFDPNSPDDRPIANVTASDGDPQAAGSLNAQDNDRQNKLMSFGSLSPDTQAAVEALQPRQGGLFGNMQTAQAGTRNSNGPSLQTLQAIKQHEGFRATPYWDVNAHRIGYGSDTITRADGSIVKVRPGMRVSRTDADRDLARRVRGFQSGVQSQIGQKTWSNLSPGSRTALTSIAYNYGSLPRSVVGAVKSGNIARVKAAIRGLGHHNKGINRGRRNKEASIYGQ